MNVKAKLIGGPWDGVILDLPLEPKPPEEIIFRSPLFLPHVESVYKLDYANLRCLRPWPAHFMYRHVGASEVFGVIHNQARQMLVREDEILRLKKRLETFGRRIGRIKAGQKAAKTRKARR